MCWIALALGMLCAGCQQIEAFLSNGDAIEAPTKAEPKPVHDDRAAAEPAAAHATEPPGKKEASAEKISGSHGELLPPIEGVEEFFPKGLYYNDGAWHAVLFQDRAFARSHPIVGGRFGAPVAEREDNFAVTMRVFGNADALWLYSSPRRKGGMRLLRLAPKPAVEKIIEGCGRRGARRVLPDPDHAGELIGIVACQHDDGYIMIGRFDTATGSMKQIFKGPSSGFLSPLGAASPTYFVGGFQAKFEGPTTLAWFSPEGDKRAEIQTEEDVSELIVTEDGTIYYNTAPEGDKESERELHFGRITLGGKPERIATITEVAPGPVELVACGDSVWAVDARGHRDGPFAVRAWNLRDDKPTPEVVWEGSPFGKSPGSSGPGRVERVRPVLGCRPGQVAAIVRLTIDRDQPRERVNVLHVTWPS